MRAMPNLIRDASDMEYRRNLAFAIIGCGSAGKTGGALKAACDPSLVRAAKAAKQHEGCRTTASGEEVFTTQILTQVTAQVGTFPLKKKPR
jgi:hypothetical protein